MSNGNRFYLSDMESVSIKDVSKLKSLITPSDKFSETSKRNLSQCHPLLIVLFNKVVEVRDCSIIKGHRGQLAQDAAYKLGNTKLKFPFSKHNQVPSIAVDAQPFPFKEGNIEDWFHFLGVVYACARILGIDIRTGYDWDSDGDFTDHNFVDLYHTELAL